MRDSGQTWIGMIPEDWNLSRIGSLYTLRNEKVSDKDYPPLSVTMKGVVPQLETAAKTDDGDNRKLVRIGDFAINSRSDRRGSCGISLYDGSVSLINTVLTPRGKMNPGYYNWLFHTVAFADEFYKWGHGIVDDLWTTRWQEMKRIIVPVPSLDAQRKIADYLDNIVSQIDLIISAAQVSIDEYKEWKASVIFEAVTKGLNPDVEMKESGIEWIGKIPVNWHMCPIKRLTTKIGSGKTPSGGAEVYSDEGVLFLRSQNVYDTGLILEDVSHISDEIDSDMKNTRVEYKDVLLNITGGSIGCCCLFDLPGVRANVNQHVCILRTKQTDLMPEFLRYFWNSAIGSVVVSYYQTGGNRQGLNFEQIGRVKIPLCPLDTQKSIVEFLDKRCATINELIAEKHGLIKDMEAFKRSLIYEIVTGKRKVV